MFICSFKLRGFVQKRIYRKKHLFLCKLSQRNMLFKIVICFNERHSSSHILKTTINIKKCFSQFSFTHFYTPLHSSKSHNLSQSIYKETDIYYLNSYSMLYIFAFSIQQMNTSWPPLRLMMAFHIITTTNNTLLLIL